MSDMELAMLPEVNRLFIPFLDCFNVLFSESSLVKLLLLSFFFDLPLLYAGNIL